MSISAHLLRKLQETLGTDAAKDLANIVDGVDALRADIAELRHETRREFGEIRRELAVIETRLNSCVTKADLEKAMLLQTRWILGGLVVILLAFWFKG